MKKRFSVIVGFVALLSAFVSCKKEETKLYDWADPTVKIESVEGSDMMDTIRVKLALTSEDGFISKVDMYLDDPEGFCSVTALYATETKAPFEFVILPGSIAAGKHELKFVAYDDLGNRAEPVATEITVTTNAEELPDSFLSGGVSLPAGLLLVDWSVGEAGVDDDVCLVSKGSGAYAVGYRTITSSATFLTFSTRSDVDFYLDGKLQTPVKVTYNDEWVENVYAISVSKRSPRRAFKWVSKSVAKLDKVVFEEHDLATFVLDEATKIGPDAATVSSAISIADGKTEVESAGFYYSLDKKKISTKASAALVGGKYVAELSGLKADTTYYVIAYAIHTLTGAEAVSADTITFKTRASFGDEVTCKASSFCQIATIEVEFKATSTEPFVRRGICYGLSQNPTTDDNVIVLAGSEAKYTEDLALPIGVTTYIRAFVVRDYAGTEVVIYSKQVSVVGKSGVTFDDVDVSDITGSSASVTATVAYGTNIPSKSGVEISKTTDFKEAKTFEVAVNNQINAKVSGLDHLTTYYYRVFCEVEGKKVYSETASFATTDLVPGDSFDGGLVVNSSTKIICSNGTISDGSVWSSSYDARKVGKAAGATSTTDGETNTTTIVEFYNGMFSSEDGAFAALVCSNARWYLPSKEEMLEVGALLLEKEIYGTFWTSTEADASNAWVVVVNKTTGVNATVADKASSKSVVGVREY